MKLIFASIFFVFSQGAFSQSLESYRSQAEINAHRNLEGANLDKRAEPYKSTVKPGTLRPPTPVEVVRSNTKREIHTIISSGGHSSRRR